MAAITTSLEFGAVFPSRPPPSPSTPESLPTTSISFGAPITNPTPTSSDPLETFTTPASATNRNSGAITVIGPIIPSSDPANSSDVRLPASTESPWPLYLDVSKPTFESPFSEPSSLIACIFGFAAFVVILISALIILRHRQLENSGTGTGPSQAEEARWRRVFGDGYIVGHKRTASSGNPQRPDLEKGFAYGDSKPQNKPVPMLQPLPYVQGRQGPTEWVGSGNVGRRLSRALMNGVNGLLHSPMSNYETSDLGRGLSRTGTRRSTVSRTSSKISKSIRSLKKKSSAASLRYDHIPSLHYPSGISHLPTDKVPFDVEENSPERENTRSPDPLLRKKSSNASLSTSLRSVPSFRRTPSRHRSAVGRGFHPAGESFMEQDEPSDEEVLGPMPSSHGTLGTLASSSLHSHVPSVSRGWRLYQPEVPPLPPHLGFTTPDSAKTITPIRR